MEVSLVRVQFLCSSGAASVMWEELSPLCPTCTASLQGSAERS